MSVCVGRILWRAFAGGGVPSSALLTLRQHQMLASLTGRLMFFPACRGGRQSRAVAPGRGTSEGAGCGGGARHRRGRAR